MKTELKDLEEKKPLTREDKEKQIKYLIGFIDEFKNVMESEKLFGMCRFILVSFIEDPEDMKELFSMLESLESLEQLEKEATLEEVGEAATLADVPHTAYNILKEILEEMQGEDPKQLKKDASELIEQLYKRPDSLLMPTNKFTNLLFDPDKQEKLLDRRKINVASDKHQVIIDARAFVMSKNDEILPPNLTAYDREVLNGVISIYDAAQGTNGVFTVAQVAEAFTGKKTTSPQALGHITRSLNKLRSTICYIDWTNHAQEYAKRKKLTMAANTTVATDEPLLMLRGLTIKANGKIVENAYQFVAPPILYAYSKSVGQIMAVDKGLLDVNINNTDESIVLKNYMLRRIEGMKNNRNNLHSNIILFDTMFKECNISEGDRNQTKRSRDNIFKILDAWKEPTPEELKKAKTASELEQLKKLHKGYIKDYVVHTGKKNKMVSVEILL